MDVGACCEQFLFCWGPADPLTNNFSLGCPGCSVDFPGFPGGRAEFPGARVGHKDFRGFPVNQKFDLFQARM